MNVKTFPLNSSYILTEDIKSFFRMSLINSHKFIKKEGISKFIEAQIEKWQCPQCGEVICCHNGICFNCSSDELLNKKKLYIWKINN